MTVYFLYNLRKNLLAKLFNEGIYNIVNADNYYRYRDVDFVLICILLFTNTKSLFPCL